MHRILLFAYGTLLDGRVQRRVFGRTVEARGAALAGWSVVPRAVRKRYAGLVLRPGARANGGLLTLRTGELARADAYEDAPRLYRRRRVVARIGGRSVRCWVYVPDGAILTGVAGRNRLHHGGGF